MKKITCLGLVCLILVSLLSCAFAADDEIWIVSRNIGVSSENDNIIFNELEKRTGLKLKWDLKSSEQYPQQCQTIIAGGNYPDLMEFWCSSYPNDLQELADDGLLLPLDDLLAEYGQEILAARPDESGWFRSKTDGKTYAVPCRFQKARTNDIMLIRKDWLDNLGLEVPTNVDELKKTLQAFQDNSELLTGKKDVKLVHGTFNTGTWETMEMGIFGVIASQYGFVRDWNVVGDDVTYFVNMPGYRDTLKAIRDIYQAGLMETEYSMMNRDQFVEKQVQNIYGTFDWYLSHIDPVTGPLIAPYMSAVPEAELVPIYPFEDENGVRRLRGNTMAQQAVIFADSADKAPDIIKLLNYMISEDGWYLLEMGLEGQHWKRNEDGSITVFNLTQEQKIEMGYWQYDWLCKRDQVNPATPKKVLEYVDEYSKITLEPPVIAVTDTSLEMGSTLADLVKKSETQLICNPSIDFDKEFDSYVAQWNDYGGAQWTIEMNDEYHNRIVK